MSCDCLFRTRLTVSFLSREDPTNALSLCVLGAVQQDHAVLFVSQIHSFFHCASQGNRGVVISSVTANKMKLYLGFNLSGTCSAPYGGVCLLISISSVLTPMQGT